MCDRPSLNWDKASQIKILKQNKHHKIIISVGVTSLLCCLAHFNFESVLSWFPKFYYKLPIFILIISNLIFFLHCVITILIQMKKNKIINRCDGLARIYFPFLGSFFWRNCIRSPCFLLNT